MGRKPEEPGHQPEIAPGEDHVGRLPGEVGPLRHGDGKIGLRQRGSVVHPVPDHRHDLALLLPSSDLLGFVCGVEAAGVVVETDLSGYGADRPRIVARQHGRPHAQAGEIPEGRPGRWVRLVPKHDESRPRSRPG